MDDPSIWIANADVFADLPEKILSQCGLVTGLLVAALVWTTRQLAKERADREAERAQLMQVIRAQNTSYDNLAVSHAKLEGILLAANKRR